MSKHKFGCYQVVINPLIKAYTLLYLLSLVRHHHWFLVRVAFSHTRADVIWQPSIPAISLADANGCQLTFGKVTFRFAPY